MSDELTRGPEPTLQEQRMDLRAKLAAGEITMDQYVAAKSALSGIPAPPPAPTAPVRQPNIGDEHARGVTPRKSLNPDEQARQYVKERTRDIAWQEAVPVHEAEIKASREADAQFGVETGRSPATPGEAIKRAISPRTLDSTAEVVPGWKEPQQSQDQRKALAHAAYRAVDKAWSDGEWGAAAEAAETAWAAWDYRSTPTKVYGYDGVEAGQRAVVVEGPTAHSVRVLGTLLGNLPIELAGRAGEAVGWTTQEARARTWRDAADGPVGSFVMDWAQSVERNEGFTELVQSSLYSTGSRPGDKLWTAGTLAGVAVDLLMPWEAIALSPVTKPMKAVQAIRAMGAAQDVVGTAGEVASAKRLAATKVAGPEWAERLPESLRFDVLDVGVAARRAAEADMAAGRAPTVTPALKTRMQTAAPGENVDALLDAWKTERLPEQAAHIASLVEDAVRQHARRLLGSEFLTRSGTMSMVTLAEKRKGILALRDKLNRLGLSTERLKQVGRSIVEGRGSKELPHLTFGPGEKEAVGGFLAQVNEGMSSLPPILPVERGDDIIVPLPDWREAILRYEDITAGRSAQVRSALKRSRPVAETLSRGVDAVAQTLGKDKDFVEKWKSRIYRTLAYPYRDKQFHDADPRYAATISDHLRHIERSAEDIAQELKRAEYRAKQQGVPFRPQQHLQSLLEDDPFFPTEDGLDFIGKYDALLVAERDERIAAQTTLRTTGVEVPENPREQEWRELAEMAHRIIGNHPKFLGLRAHAEMPVRGLRSLVAAAAAREKEGLVDFSRLAGHSFALSRDRVDDVFGTLEVAKPLYRAFAEGYESLARFLRVDSASLGRGQKAAESIGAPIALDDRVADEAGGMYSLLVRYKARARAREMIRDLAAKDYAIAARYTDADIRWEVEALLTRQKLPEVIEVDTRRVRMPKWGRQDSEFAKWARQWRGPVAERVNRAEQLAAAGVKKGDFDNKGAFADHAVRSAEPGARAHLSEYEQIAHRSPDEGYAYLQNFPGDVVDPKYVVYSWQEGRAVKTRIPLPEAMDLLLSRQDPHDVVQVAGSDRPIARWSQGPAEARRPRKNAKPRHGKGDLVVDYDGASPAEKALVQTDPRYAGAKIPTGVLETKLAGRTDKYVTVKIPSTNHKHQAAIERIERWGIGPVPHGSLARVGVGDPTEYDIPAELKTAMEQAVSRASLQRSDIFEPAKSPLSDPVRRGLTWLYRFHKTATIYGISAFLHTKFFVNSLASNPLILMQTMGQRYTGELLQFVMSKENRGIIGESLKRASRYWYQFEPDASARVLVTDNGMVWTIDEIADAMRRYGIDSTHARTESSDMLLRDVRMLETGQKKGKVQWIGDKFKASQQILIEFGHAVDQVYRVPVFLHELKKGTPVDEAARVARDALYDYGALTDRERFVWRKLVTFYTWYRKNLDSFLYNLVKNPSRIGQQLRLARDSRTVWGESPSIGEWDTNAARLVVGAKKGAVDDHGRKDYTTKGVFWYMMPIPAAEAAGLFSHLLNAALSMAPGTSPYKAATGPESAIYLLGLTNPAGRLAYQAVTGKVPGGPFDAGSDRTNRIPDWLMDLDQHFGGAVSDYILGAHEVPTDDVAQSEDPESARPSYWAASGGGQTAMTGVRESPVGRHVFSSIPDFYRAIIDEPRPGMTQLGEATSIFVLPSKIATDERALQRIKADKAHRIDAATTPVTIRRKTRE